MNVRRKQVTDQAEWVNALAAIRAGRYNWTRLDRLIDVAVDHIRKTVSGKNAAYAWSGGKDSIAVGYVAELAGVRECMMGMTRALEYPAFLQWVTAHMPNQLEVIDTGQDLEWLARNLDMLFPATSAIAARWFKLVQHTAQERYYRDRKLDVLILGRRKADGNYIDGGDGSLFYVNTKGITRYSPIAEWRHEDVLALVERSGISWPPIYQWPRGYQVGTHAWPARQWCGSIQNGWREVQSIDPAVVMEAAGSIQSARDFLESG